jgi:integrase
VLARLKRGEFEAIGPGSWGLGTRPNEPKKPVSFNVLLDRWVAERKPAEKTRYEWTRVFNEFRRHVQHDDACLVTREDVVSWKNSLVDAGGSTKTIRDAKLAPLRAIFQVAVDNQLLPINPAANLPIKLKAKPGQGRRGYTNAEARIVLAAAAEARDPVRRWVPMLGAYSGARVAEICQLRVQDITEIDGIHCMSFTAEAGPLKTESSERTIPIHTAIIDAGFLEFVASIESGPLFVQLKPDKFGSRGGTGTKVLGRWVRSLGLKDTRLAPNHSWRHRMRTLARDYMLQPDLIDAITGHRKRTVADGYGEFPMRALKRELDKIPVLSLSPEMM